MRYIYVFNLVLASVVLALFWSGSLSSDIWNYGYSQLLMGQLASASLVLSLKSLIKN